MSALVQLFDLHYRATRARYRGPRSVCRLRLGNALFELVASFLRGRAACVHRALYLLTLDVECVSSGIDLVLDAPPRIVKRVDDRVSDVVRNMLGCAPNS